MNRKNVIVKIADVNMSKIKILAIDPASTLGWALSNTEYGLWDLKTRRDESMGMKLLRLKAKLDEIHELEKIDMLAYERPAGRHTVAVIHHAKLVGKIEEWCEDNGVQYKGYSATEIKKFATGKGNANKEKMIAAAQTKLGYRGEDDNEADALWLLNLCREELNG